MYADIGLLFPYFQNLSPEVQQYEDFCKTHKSNALMRNLIPTSMVSDYDLGGDGDLFKAPEPIMEEPMIGLDPLKATISMISCGEDVISSHQAFKAADIESLQKEQLLSEVFYECEQDLLEKAAKESPLSEVLDIKIPIFTTNENQLQENKPLSDAPSQTGVSSGCLRSRQWVHEAATKTNFLEFPGMDLGVTFGMRRAFSEGDIKALGNGSIHFMHSPRPLNISYCTSEERREKLSRYRNKKTKRNFGRKIKYACRKVLADSQPRIRGRFAKTEESEN